MTFLVGIYGWAAEDNGFSSYPTNCILSPVVFPTILCVVVCAFG